MTDQWLRTFILSAECGSFSKAAKALYISTPSLVQQINLFEKELGFKVFERSSAGLRLTPAGESFLETAKMMQDVYQDGKKRAESIAANNARELNFGFAPYQFPEHWLNLLNEFHDTSSEINIHLVAVSMQEQIPAVHAGKIDVCLIARPQETYLGDLRYMELLEDTYSFCMSGKHPLARKSRITKDDLKGCTVVCGDYPYMEQSFDSALKDAAEIRHLPTEYDLGARFGISPDELFVVHSKWHEPFSVLHRVIDSDISAGGVGFVYSRRNEQAVKALLDFFRENDE